MGSVPRTRFGATAVPLPPFWRIQPPFHSQTRRQPPPRLPLKTTAAMNTPSGQNRQRPPLLLWSRTQNTLPSPQPDDAIAALSARPLSDESSAAAQLSLVKDGGCVNCPFPDEAVATARPLLEETAAAAAHPPFGRGHGRGRGLPLSQMMPLSHQGHERRPPPTGTRQSLQSPSGTRPRQPLVPLPG